MPSWSSIRGRIPRIAAKHLLVDLFIMALSIYGAIYLRVGPGQYAEYATILHAYVPWIIGIRVLTMVGFRCYAVMWRYISTIDAVRLGEAIAVSTGLTLAISFFVRGDLILLPRSVFFIDALLVTVGLMGIRLVRRLMHEGTGNTSVSHGKRTLIYGAGQNGRHLAHRFKLDPSAHTTVVGFIDDDAAKANLVINGTPVLGNRAALAMLIEQHRISQVIVAIPELSGTFLRDLIMITRNFNIKPRITSRLAQTEFKNRDQVEIVREINLADLLNHPPRKIDLTSIRNLIHGKCVLVTGAGGTIGSEIARQVLQYEPSRLLLLDHAEFNLYEIDSSLRLAISENQRVLPLMLDIKNESLLRKTISHFEPDVVFHAAAYKHVHLVEANANAAILNNIGGTLNLLAICRDLNVHTFVNISTDKAVNPGGIMGATKRVCELLVSAFAACDGRNYCSVRFGNVLGSSGSLIPLLKNQIELGGPITLTHPEMNRFFMLIPEAVALVLKASTISKPGDIDILKMGEPIPIVDIAKNLLALMGKTESEIPIVYTGIRPGEKLSEELYIRGDEFETEHPDILTLPNGAVPISDDPRSELAKLLAEVHAILENANDGKPEAAALLNRLLRTYHDVQQASPTASKTKSGLTQSH